MKTDEYLNKVIDAVVSMDDKGLEKSVLKGKGYSTGAVISLIQFPNK